MEGWGWGGVELAGKTSRSVHIFITKQKRFKKKKIIINIRPQRGNGAFNSNRWRSPPPPLPLLFGWATVAAVSSAAT